MSAADTSFTLEGIEVVQIVAAGDYRSEPQMGDQDGPT